MTENTKASRLGEIIRFVITGGVCFAVEFAALVFCREWLRLDTLIAAPIAFLASVVVNYLMCMVWVFKGTKDSGHAARLGFMLTSLIGLLLNEIFMLLFRHLFGEEQILFTLFGFSLSMYMVNKVIATLLVMIWNYFTKKAVLNSDLISRLLSRKTNP